jgi:hypothetical protein
VLRKLKGKSKKSKVKKKGKGERLTTPKTQRGEPRIEDRRKKIDGSREQRAKGKGQRAGEKAIDEGSRIEDR